MALKAVKLVGATSLRFFSASILASPIGPGCVARDVRLRTCGGDCDPSSDEIFGGWLKKWLKLKQFGRVETTYGLQNLIGSEHDEEKLLEICSEPWIT